MSDLWYVPRLTIPDPDDLNWIKYTAGGYNAYTLSGSPQYSANSVLSNCTSYAWGRWREILGRSHNLPVANGGNWYAHSDGYERSTTTPRLGCVACWGGSGVEGHVAIVEEIYYTSGGAIDHCVVSQSGWGWADTFRTRTIRPSDGWWIYNDVGSFQGFIYLPVDFLPCPIFQRRKKVKVNIR